MHCTPCGHPLAFAFRSQSCPLLLPPATPHEVLHSATAPPPACDRQQTFVPPQSADDVQRSAVLPVVGHVVPSTQVDWVPKLD
jgi:hypothetical protein